MYNLHAAGSGQVVYNEWLMSAFNIFMVGGLYTSWWMQLTHSAWKRLVTTLVLFVWYPEMYAWLVRLVSRIASADCFSLSICDILDS
jgi:hypothetical protein